jgi:ATP-dependent Clp protease ATP-binding subunit ClpX
MDGAGVSTDLITCSFYAKEQTRVKRIVAGLNAYICDECVGLCDDILVQELSARPKVPVIWIGAS